MSTVNYSIKKYVFAFQCKNVKPPALSLVCQNHIARLLKIWYLWAIVAVCASLHGGQCAEGAIKMERISPTGDLAFKKVLASEENKDILAGLIGDSEPKALV